MLKWCKKVLSNNLNFSLPRIWIAVFIYKAFVAILVQFVILVYIFPSWNSGEGLIRGLDANYFHHIAVELSAEIKTHGWSAWKLCPGDNSGQSVSGIVGAIYALTIPKPWVIIPLNAALHATSAVLLFLMLSSFVSSRKICLLGILPFIFYPCAALWYAQIHKDGLFITSLFTFALGWVMISSDLKQKKDLFNLSRGLILIGLGIFLVWLIRPYCVEIFFAISILIALILTIIFLYSVLVLDKLRRKYFFLFLFFWIPILLIKPLTSNEPAKVIYPTGKSIAKFPTAIQPAPEQAVIVSKNSLSSDKIIRSKENVSKKMYYKEISGAILAWMKSKFDTIVIRRAGSANTGGKTLIDAGVSFKTPLDFIKYLPRLAQISFFAPFPNIWFTEGNTFETTIMRKISAFEMIVNYFFYLFLPVAAWNFRRRVNFWIILLFFGSTLLIFGFTIVNIGTLYRIRYGFIMPFVSFGVVGFILFVNKILNKDEEVEGVSIVDRMAVLNVSVSSNKPLNCPMGAAVIGVILGLILTLILG